MELFKPFHIDTKFDPNRRKLIKVGAATAGALVVGVGIPNILDLTPSAVAQKFCPDLATDGDPAQCLTTAKYLEGYSRFGGLYFVGNPGAEFNLSSRIIQGVGGRRFLIETLHAEQTSDHVQIDPYSRKIEGGIPTYQDRKNGGIRSVASAAVWEIDADGGNGLAHDARGNEVMKWSVQEGAKIDKIWGPVDPRLRKSRSESICDGNCGWNCVQWIRFSRLNANFDISRFPANQIPNEAIHTYNGRPSAYTDAIYLWDPTEIVPKIDYNGIHSPVQMESELAKKEDLKFNPNVFVPDYFVPYSN